MVLGVSAGKTNQTHDFCIQYTVRFTVLYIFVIMELGSRQVVQVGVTGHPTLKWVKQQVRNVTFNTQPKFLIHDNDGIYGQLGKPLTMEVDDRKVLEGCKLLTQGQILHDQIISGSESGSQQTSCFQEIMGFHADTIGAQ